MGTPQTHTRCAAIRRLECSLREETGEEWTSIINICWSSTRWLNFTLPTSSNVEWSLLSAYMYIKICPVSQCPQETQPKAQVALLARRLLSWPSILMSQTSWHRNMEQASELSPVQPGSSVFILIVSNEVPPSHPNKVHTLRPLLWYLFPHEPHGCICSLSSLRPQLKCPFIKINPPGLKYIFHSIS